MGVEVNEAAESKPAKNMGKGDGKLDRTPVDIVITKEEGHRHGGELIAKGTKITVQKHQANRLIEGRIAEPAK